MLVQKHKRSENKRNEKDKAKSGKENEASKTETKTNQQFSNFLTITFAMEWATFVTAQVGKAVAAPPESIERLEETVPKLDIKPWFQENHAVTQHESIHFSNALSLQ